MNGKRKAEIGKLETSSSSAFSCRSVACDFSSASVKSNAKDSVLFALFA